MSGTKLSFSLKTQKKLKAPVTNNVASSDFEVVEERRYANNDDEINTDLPREPLVIPVQKDGRQSLQEQARLRRLRQQQQQQQEQQEHEQQEQEQVKDQEDQAAIEALNAQAGRKGMDDAAENSSKLIIAGSQNTFQQGGVGRPQRIEEKDDDPDAKQLRLDLEHLVPEVSVDSDVYRQVPISDFGAAMLRGMGWTGQVDKSDTNTMSLPRPSRLGLGATPKLLDIPTHGRKPRRQDQVQREEQLKQQQEEFEKKRLEQINLDKQLTIQDGSIVRDCNSKTLRRGIIRKFHGVPGLNMILVQFEGDGDAVKVRKGDVQLIGREELLKKPFQEPEYMQEEKQVEYLGDMIPNVQQEKGHERSRDKGERGNDDNKKRQQHSSRDHDRRRDSHDDDKRNDSRSSRKRRDDGEHRKEHRKRQKDDDQLSHPATWLIPHIRVRVVTTKYGKEFYKEKGVVVDVSRKGAATLTMSNGQVLQVPERYLETALPKVGGNACILTGTNRLAKGCLLERDSKANRGSIQVFEDMNIVTTSLDDMAEWCGPLDDDLME